MDAVESLMEERKAKVDEARRQKAEEEKKREEAAMEEKEREITRIRNLRQKKIQLEKTLAEGQKLIYKQCYSRPLYNNYNKK